MKKEVVDAIEAIGEYRVRNPATIFQYNGELRSWTEMGSDSDIAYKMYGKYVACEIEGSFYEYVDDELSGAVYFTRDFVIDHVEVPEQYDSDKVIDELTGKINKSLFCGATVIQLKTFLEKQQHELDEGTFGTKKRRN